MTADFPRLSWLQRPLCAMAPASRWSGRQALALCCGTWLLLLLLLAAPPAWAQTATAPAPAPAAEAPATEAAGSAIRPFMTLGAAYPLDKTYAQLSRDEVEALKNFWEPMPDADEPPFPAQGMKQLTMDLAAASQRRQAQGDLALAAHVDARGKVTKVDIYASPEEQLTRFAVWRLMNTAFKPALCGGAACAMQFPLRITFALE